MATEVVMPQMGYDMTEGRIAQWLKQPGEQVKQGEALAEIETDKVTVEIEASVDGLLLAVLVGEGESVPVGQVIAIIGEPGEPVPEPQASRASDAHPTPEAAQGSAQTNPGADVTEG